VVAMCIAMAIHMAANLGVVPANSTYSDPSLPWVIVALSLTAVIRGFQSTKLFEANRNLSLRSVTIVELVSQVVSLSFMLVWLAIDRSIWALVGGSISSVVIYVALSHAWISGVNNRWQWDQVAFWEVFHFGKWLFISSILTFFAVNGDRFL